jgi:hypothetical protein
MMRLFRLRVSMTIALAAAVIGGCSELTATVSGTVNLDGKPLRIAKSQRGTVLFRPVEGGATATALIDEHGKYSITTGGSSGLAPGDYLVAVRATEITPAIADSPAPTGKPFTPYVYGDPIESGLMCIVRRGDQTYDIELSSAASPVVNELETDESAATDDQAPTDKIEAQSESDDLETEEIDGQPRL